MLSRTPPDAVIRELRREVGYACPIRGCDNPYLTWHHFAPPWEIEHHHRAEGMIALCAEHHKKADAGAYTKEQLHALKSKPRQNRLISGNFEWMRRELLVIVGGNFFYETPVALEYRDRHSIWFNRDGDNCLLLNIEMITNSFKPRVKVRDNWWNEYGIPQDLISPPAGRLLEAKYSNGDYIKIEFYELMDMETIRRSFPGSKPERWDLPYPITAVEIHSKSPELGINISPREIVSGGATLRNCFARKCNIALAIK